VRKQICIEGGIVALNELEEAAASYWASSQKEASSSTNKINSPLRRYVEFTQRLAFFENDRTKFVEIILIRVKAVLAGRCYLFAMNQTEHLIDVREIAPKQKHPTIFNTWNELPPGESILLLNDHDPLPLYYQFACEFTGEFRWEYLERGPATWQVRISKGEFADPGFVPEKKKVAHACVAPRPIQFVEPFVLDTRPIFAKGETPCHEIDDAVAKLIPGQLLILLVPFEPIPLYAKLGKDGFSHRASQLEDGTWRAEFRKTS